jgi:redox-sensitive bicupin YhaK (pirin superfamily)
MELIKANSRGNANFGWLDSYHTFSFGNYYNPKRMGFGKLRVFNDDTVAPSNGFGTHPHDNMEIITIPTKGSIEHRDSMGTSGIIKPWDVQVMSAGTGIYHSEINPSSSEILEFFQIWILPDKRNSKPRYDQKNFYQQIERNHFLTMVGPQPSETYLRINQNAYISRVIADQNKELEYRSKIDHSAIFIFVIEGKLQTEDEVLNRRDSLGISQAENCKFSTLEESDVLIIETPL